MASAAVRSEVFVLLLLLIYCLLLPPPHCLWVFLFCFVVISVPPRFTIIFASRFIVIVLLMDCDCLRFVAYPRGAVGWSAVCDCGIC